MKHILEKSRRGARSPTQTDARVRKAVGVNITFQTLVDMIQREKQVRYEVARRHAHIMIEEMETMTRQARESDWRYFQLWSEQ